MFVPAVHHSRCQVCKFVHKFVGVVVVVVVENCLRMASFGGVRRAAGSLELKKTN